MVIASNGKEFFIFTIYSTTLICQKKKEKNVGLFNCHTLVCVYKPPKNPNIIKFIENIFFHQKKKRKILINVLNTDQNDG